VRASAVTYVAPIIAVFWDYVFFRNVPDRFEVIGVLAVLSGVVLLHAPSAPKLAPARVVELAPESVLKR
jgi:drug/metabolite transporter (DMT)-like permease